MSVVRMRSLKSLGAMKMGLPFAFHRSSIYRTIWQLMYDVSTESANIKEFVFNSLSTVFPIFLYLSFVLLLRLLLFWSVLSVDNIQKSN